MERGRPTCGVRSGKAASRRALAPFHGGNLAQPGERCTAMTPILDGACNCMLLQENRTLAKLLLDVSTDLFTSRSRTADPFSCRSRTGAEVGLRSCNREISRAGDRCVVYAGAVRARKGATKGPKGCGEAATPRAHRNYKLNTNGPFHVQPVFLSPAIQPTTAEDPSRAVPW